jgi:CheY-like chemotaxis protein
MEQQNSPLNNKHVLVVDDDIQLALTYEALLQIHGYQVSTASDGEEALKLVLNSDVDAILCDLNMPGLSGDLFYLEVARARPHLLKRFLFVTGNANDPLYEDFLKNLQAPVLSKPVSFDHLIGKIKSILGTETVPVK